MSAKKNFNPSFFNSPFPIYLFIIIVRQPPLSASLSGLVISNEREGLGVRSSQTISQAL